MLRDEVIEAVSAGRSRIWAVATIDEGLKLLSGIPAGSAPSTESSPTRHFTEGSRSGCCQWPRPRAGSTLGPHADRVPTASAARYLGDA